MGKPFHNNNNITVQLKIFAGQKFRQAQLASYLCVAEIFGGINFRQCGKGRHAYPLCTCLGQNLQIKISPMRAGGEIGTKFSPGENFQLYGMPVPATIFRQTSLTRVVVLPLLFWCSVNGILAFIPRVPNLFNVHKKLEC